MSQKYDHFGGTTHIHNSYTNYINSDR